VANTVTFKKEAPNASVHAYLVTLEIHQTADPNVLSILNVAKIWHVLTKNVQIHVDLAFVVRMPSVMCSTIMQFVPVYLVIKVHLTLSSDVIEYLSLLSKNLLIRAGLIPVDGMLSAETKMDMRTAGANQDILVHLPTVDLNVPSMQIVQAAKHVFNRNVEILVLEYVALMPNVM
jgi:hypothetical protein